MIEIKNHQYFRQEKWAWHALDSATPMSFDIFFLIVVISLCINQIDIVGVVYSWFSDCHALLLQYSEFSSSNRLNIFKVFIYRVNNQRVMTTKLLKHHCYKNYSPLQLVGTKHHGFRTLVGPRSKHFGFQYKLKLKLYFYSKLFDTWNMCKMTQKDIIFFLKNNWGFFYYFK